MPRIPDQLLHSVVFFYSSEANAYDGALAGGTGFLVQLPGNADQAVFRYAITNQHVVASGGTFLRFNRPSGGIEVLEIPLWKWVRHPDGDDIIVASISPDELIDSLTGFAWANFAATQERLTELNVGVGDEVFMLGRFIAHSGIQKNQPLARFGNIAMMPDERVLDGRGMRVDAYLIEMRSLSGFSGSPVFVYIAPGNYRGNGTMMPFYSETIGLIGIDTGHKLMPDTVDKPSKTEDEAGWVVKYNTGIAIVAPFWKIREVLNDPELLTHRGETNLA